MTQIVIDIGAVPNDGTGDPLRTAFNDVNLNFANVFAAGPVDSNIQIVNNTILTTNVNGNLVLAPNGIGVVQSNVSIVPNTANIRNLGSSTQRWATVYSQYLNISGTVSLADLTVNGNLTVTGNTIQIGNITTETKTIQLANAASTANAANGSGVTVGSNDDIATLLYNSTSNVWTTNIGISSVGNITAPYFFGNGSQLTGLPAIYGNANVVANLAALGSNPVSTTGNITGGFIFGNISLANGFPATYGNANVANYLPTFSGNISAGNISATGNITGAYVKGNGSALTSLPAPTVTQDITSNGAMSIMTYDGVIKYVNYATVEPSSGNIAAGNISTTGNVTGNYFFGNGSQLTGITANTGNVTFSNQIVLGTGTNDGSGGLYLAPGTDSIANSAVQYLRVRGGDALTHIHLDTGNNAYYDQYFGNDNKFVKLEAGDAGNVVVGTDDNGNSYNWTFDTAGNLTLPGNTIAINYANGNLAFGTVTFNNEAVIGTGTSNTQSGLYLAPDPVSLANDLYLRVRGNILDEPTHIHFDTGNNQYYNQFIGDDNKYVQLANTGNIVINTSDYVGNTAQWTFNTAGTLTLPGGSRIRPLGANLDIFAGTGSYVNLITSDESSSMGVAGSGGYITTTGGTWGFGTTGNLTAPGNVSAVGNVTGGNIVTSGSGGDITLTGGNITGAGNISAGNVSVTGNITGAYVLGNGSQLTGLPATYGNANVATFLAGFGSNTVSTTGNITTGNLLTGGQVSATGNIVTAGNFVGNGAALTNVTVSVAGNIVGTQSNVTVVAGAYNWTFNNTGNLTLPGNTFAVNYANNTPVNAVTRFESSWTVPTGNSTQSFTVGANETYYLWVDCNIPNGILAWNATATVTNTNVPVVGAQYAWVYSGGGTPIDFTSIPNQFVGTSNTIVRSSVAPSATTNRFDFGINNTSGNAVTVRYGWIAIS